jgi:serine phosphatase RsbU (regulator of sigma subunit)
MAQKNKQSLSTLISHNYLKSSLIPIFTVEVILLVLYFSMNSFIASKSENIIIEEAKNSVSETLSKQAEVINSQLKEVENIARVLQAEHQYLFKNFEFIPLPQINKRPKFAKAENGSFYKTSLGGSAVYYSDTTKIGERELKKAIITEAFDGGFKSIIENSKIISAIYINTFDDMNRIYPYISDIYNTYGSSINMEDYNFYFLADAKNNPSRGPVWTEVYLDPAGQGYMLSCVIPVYRDDFLEGVTGLDVTVINFTKNILEFSLPWKSDTFMMTKDGEILAINKETRELLNVETNETNLLKANNDFGLKVKNDGILELKLFNKNYLIVSRKIEATGWVLISIMKKEELFKNINELKNITNTIGIYTILLMILFYFIFFVLLFKYSKRIASWISTPIVALAEKTKNIENIENKDSDISEISELLSNFFSMSKEIMTHRQELEKLVAERTDSLTKVMRNLNDSIRYASFIQKSILPQDELVYNIFKDYFIIWKPRDIVGGDIYFLEKVSENEVIMFVIDCTGHGIPGAFVTLLVKGLLKQLLTEIKSGKVIHDSTSSMLHFFNGLMKEILKQDKSSSSIANVGFDGILLYYNKATNIVKLSGANSLAFIYSKNIDGSENMMQFKGDRESIGYKKSRENFEFKEEIFKVSESLKIYLLTDGIIDQKSSKEELFNFGRQRLETLITNVQNVSMAEQREIIYQAIEEFRDGSEQRDDITLLGISI